MHVQQVELRLLGYFTHLGRERQRVGRMIEQRISGDLYLMEKNPLARSGQANGHRVTDEMNLVAARGELDAQLGGDHTGAAVRRVASDSDFHADRRPRRSEPKRRRR